MRCAKQLGILSSLVGALGLAACGGGSSTGNSAPAGPVGSVPTQMTVVGSITGFGSVFVNGTKFEVASDTVVSIEGEAETVGDDSSLRLGMKVRMSASSDDGVLTARTIEFDEDLKGPIETITPDSSDPSIGTFSVMGQAVTVDSGTLFDDDVGNNDGVAGIDFRDLQVGMVVEISAFPTADGFLATRVDRQLGATGGNPDIGQPGVVGDELELKGFVESVASGNSSITVGGVVFIIDVGTIFEDGLILDAGLVGSFVEVKADVAGDQFIAVRVEREDDFDEADRNGEFEVEGVLQSVDTNATPNTFTINGTTVPVSNAASLTALVGMRVEIKGSFNADNILVLREAEQNIEDNVRTEDLVSTINIGAQTFTTRLGLVVSPTGGSRVEDNASNESGEQLTPGQFISRLQAGDRIESRGHDDSNGGIAWTRVQRDELASDNDDFECEFRGAVESIEGDASAFTFVIQGVTVLTGRTTDGNFEDANNFAIGRAEFFNRLQAGDVVEATSFEGDEFCMTATLDAREVEFEPEDVR